jgi:hypothetical protein
MAVAVTGSKNFLDESKKRIKNKTANGTSIYWAQLSELSDDQVAESLSKSFGYHTRTHREVPLWLAELCVKNLSADYGGDSYLKYTDKNNNEIASIVGWCKDGEDLASCNAGRCTVEINFLVSALVSKLIDALTGGAGAQEVQVTSSRTKEPTTPKAK